MKSEENWPRGFRGKVVQRYGRTKDGRTMTVDGLKVIKIAHPEPSAQ